MLGNNLKSIREEHGYTQEYIAQYLGKNQNTISSWENGRTQPKLKDLHSLCLLYNCTYETLTGVKQHSYDDITIDDIMSRILCMPLDELVVLKENIEIVIEKTVQIKEIEKKNAELMARLNHYKTELSKMATKTPPDSAKSDGVRG